MKIYVTCITEESVYNCADIRGVFLDKQAAILACPATGYDHERGWVWEFEPGQSWEQAVKVYDGRTPENH